MTNLRIAFVIALIMVEACSFYPETEFRAQPNGISVEGVIDDTTLDGLQRILGTNPELDTLILQYVPGSVDDENSLTLLGNFVRSRGLVTRVPSDGLVASGGTDLLTMGVQRIIEPGACIGVHTWGTRGLLGFAVGSDLPESDPSHQLYLTFYKRMGIPEEFYWFTLAAAGPNDTHWMSPDEINRFGLSTTPVRNTLDETPEQRHVRCERRI